MLETFEELQLPAMLTSSMEEVILQCKSIYGGYTKRIVTGSMTKPEEGALHKTIASLKGMKYLTSCGELTALGIFEMSFFNHLAVRIFSLIHFKHVSRFGEPSK